MRNVHGGKNPEEQQVLVIFATASFKHFLHDGGVGFSDYSWRSAVVAAGHMACAHVNDRKEWRGGGGGGEVGVEEEIDGESGGRSPTQQRALFFAFTVIEGTLCVFSPTPHQYPQPTLAGTGSGSVAVPSDIINNRGECWMRAQERRGQDNPGNNMRTLSLSRTLAEDLHCCRLP